MIPRRVRTLSRVLKRVDWIRGEIMAAKVIIYGKAG
jgi:hypothetical protein